MMVWLINFSKRHSKIALLLQETSVSCCKITNHLDQFNEVCFYYKYQKRHKDKEKDSCGKRLIFSVGFEVLEDFVVPVQGLIRAP